MFGRGSHLWDEFNVVILKISARRPRAGVFSFWEFGLMRGAALFFSALLVVVGTSHRVCLESNLNKALIVEDEPVASCSETAPTG